jgi:hypothetical protein
MRSDGAKELLVKAKAMRIVVVRGANPRRPSNERLSAYLNLGVAGVSLVVLGLLVLGLDIWTGAALVAAGVAHVAYAWRRSNAALVKRAPLRAVKSGRGSQSC